MRNVSSQGSQRPKRRNYLPSLVSFLTPKVLGFLGAVLGTACTLAFASKPQLTAKPIANAQIEVKSSVVQPPASPTARNFLTLGDRSIKKEATIFPRLRSFIDSSQASKSLPLTLKPLQRQQLQHLDSSRDAELKLSAHLKRAPQPSAQNRPTDEVDRVDALAQLPKERSTQPVVETQSSQERSQPVPTQRDVALTLSDVVILALENNRPLKNAYLERIAQRQDLVVAEDKFVPNFTPDVSISIARFRSDGTITSTDVGIGATVSVTIPTGGELRFRWDTSSQTSDFDNFGIDAIAIDNDTFGQNLQLSFQQPLLRGAGININRASIDIARLTEQGNILALKSTLIETITEAIFAYRDLLRSQERLEIEQQSLQLSKDILEATRILIEAGRVAPVDIVQSETAVANRQVSLLAAQNDFESRRLALLDILDIDRTLAIVPAETPRAKPINLDSNKLRQLAFDNRPDYLQSKLAQEISQLQLRLAEDDKRWDLSLTTSYNYFRARSSDVRAGLVLSQEFGDLTKDQRLQRSRVNLLQADNTFQDLNESIEIQIKDQIRDINLLYSQVGLAQKATILSQQQLDIEREKQRLGRGAGIFEIVRLQNELVDARNAELNVTIDYLNALTRLDRTLGTTLDTWQVKVEKQ
jgi:outer membrane protein TolC